MILDTSFLIDVLRGNDAITELERELDERDVGVVTALSVMELCEGIHLTDATDAERERVQRLLEGLTHATFDRESAMLAGKYSAKLTDAGARIEIEDVVIAAIARQRNEPILTGNPDHFERLEDVDVETYERE